MLSAYLPDAQPEHVPTPKADTVPAAHSSMLVFPETERYPAGTDVHCVDATISENFPFSHAAQVATDV